MTDDTIVRPTEAGGVAVVDSGACVDRFAPEIKYASFRELPRLTLICGGFIILIGLATLVLIMADVRGHGLAWLFFYSIAVNTAISVFPHEPAIVFAGQHYAPLVVAFVALAGSLAAGWLDYQFFTPFLQLQFSQAYRKTKIYHRTVRWFAWSPFWVVAVFALTPLPFYLAKFLVFSSEYSRWRFLAGIAVGRLPRFYLLALLGDALNVPAWMMVTFFAGVFVVYLGMIARAWVKARRTRHTSG